MADHWWRGSDWVSKAIIVGSLATVLGGFGYAWIGPISRTASLIMFGVLPFLWIYELVRNGRP